MSKRMELAVMLGIAAALSLVLCASAQAQDGGRVNVGIDYNYVRTNAPREGAGVLTCREATAGCRLTSRGTLR